METLEAIRARRSIGRLTEPAPSDEQLTEMLLAGAAAPDHESLRPWRFIVLRGEAKDAFGEVLRDAYLARVQAAGGEPTEGQLTKERTKLGRAPVVVVVAAEHLHEDSVPFIEQYAAAAAACQNILLAATDMGFGSMWRTGPVAYDASVKRALGLSEHDEIAGFLYIGTPTEGSAKPPNQPTLDGLVAHWSPRVL
jgi:nitroreductase